MPPLAQVYQRFSDGRSCAESGCSPLSSAEECAQVGAAATTGFADAEFRTVTSADWTYGCLYDYETGAYLWNTASRYICPSGPDPHGGPDACVCKCASAPGSAPGSATGSASGSAAASAAPPSPPVPPPPPAADAAAAAMPPPPSSPVPPPPPPRRPPPSSPAAAAAASGRLP